MVAQTAPDEVLRKHAVVQPAIFTRRSDSSNEAALGWKPITRCNKTYMPTLLPLFRSKTNVALVVVVLMPSLLPLYHFRRLQ